MLNKFDLKRELALHSISDNLNLISTSVLCATFSGPVYFFFKKLNTVSYQPCRCSFVNRYISDCIF